MPRSHNDQLPLTYVVSGTWPTAQLAVDAPPSAHYSQALADKLRTAIERADIGLRALGDRAGVSHATISRLLRGQVLPDIGTVARLETALGAPLWPGLAAAAVPDVPDNERLNSSIEVPDRPLALCLELEWVVGLPTDAYVAMMRSLATIYEVLTDHPHLARTAARLASAERSHDVQQAPPTA